MMTECSILFAATQVPGGFDVIQFTKGPISARQIKVRVKLIYLIAVAALLLEKPLSAQGIHHEEINAEPIAAAQKKTNWCWAAGCEMLAKSQGVDLPQEWFVKKIFGPALPNFPTGGSFEPIRRALTGKFETEDGDIVRMSGAYHYGVPTDPSGMIRSIRDGRPFIFAWEGHVYVCYALNWIDIPQLRVIELHLIDPYWKYGRSEFRTFNVFKDDPRTINGTFELLVKK